MASTPRTGSAGARNLHPLVDLQEPQLRRESSATTRRWHTGAWPVPIVRRATAVDNGDDSYYADDRFISGPILTAELRSPAPISRARSTAEPEPRRMQIP
jgi:hypothetical protein